ncbi:MAG: hypothetical protein HGA72_06225 [Chlorobiaceae bacterium]|jgi:hypothetical protein|nr:hypothetical protein [Chlorobiaceae bacterium]NTW64171.1 hypothetical protein [Chlorobiaceae bacterium]
MKRKIIGKMGEYSGREVGSLCKKCRDWGLMVRFTEKPASLVSGYLL